MPSHGAWIDPYEPYESEAHYDVVVLNGAVIGAWAA